MCLSFEIIQIHQTLTILDRPKNPETKRNERQKKKMFRTNIFITTELEAVHFYRTRAHHHHQKKTWKLIV